MPSSLFLLFSFALSRLGGGLGDLDICWCCLDLGRCSVAAAAAGLLLCLDSAGDLEERLSDLGYREEEDFPLRSRDLEQRLPPSS